MLAQVYKYVGEPGAGLLFRPKSPECNDLLNDLEPELSYLGDYEIPDQLLEEIGKDDVHPGCYGSIHTL